MKRLLCAVAAIAMIVPGVAAGQPQGNQQDKSRPARPQTKPARPAHNRPNRPDRPSIQPVRPPHQGHRPGKPSIQPVRPPHNGNRPGHRPPVTIQPIKPTKPYRPGHRPPNFRPIHRPVFHYPHGYRYRRWHVGLILPHIFLSNYYYFNDYGLLGLGPPPPGYVWVRYGPDLLLVNVHTGRIADVIYGAFY